MSLKIEIFQNQGAAISSRSFTIKSTGEHRTNYHQEAYAHLGDRFPIKTRVPIESPDHAYQPGEYTLCPQSYKIGQYGDLAINDFELLLQPLKVNLDKTDKPAPVKVAQ